MSVSDEFRKFQGTPGYIASGPLVDAVNCAIALERPLLIKGEPGTGKTLLARHVAAGLGMPMESWHVKSTSKASEGLYVYDTVQRLNDARFGDGDVGDIRRYIRLGAVGRAFAAEQRHVLLDPSVHGREVLVDVHHVAHGAASRATSSRYTRSTASAARAGSWRASG